MTTREERKTGEKAYCIAAEIRAVTGCLARREEKRAKVRANQRSLYELTRNNKLKRKYGLTLAAFEALLKAQDGACAICGTADWNSQGPHVDHDHRTGKVRGLLCSNCNLALGLMHDDALTVRAMGEYLDKFKVGRRRAKAGAK